MRSTKTVSSYIQAYRNEGLDGLEIGHSPGAPRKLSEQQEHKLFWIVANQTPHDVVMTTIITGHWLISSNGNVDKPSRSWVFLGTLKILGSITPRTGWNWYFFLLIAQC